MEVAAYQWMVYATSYPATMESLLTLFQWLFSSTLILTYSSSSPGLWPRVSESTSPRRYVKELSYYVWEPLDIGTLADTPTGLICYVTTKVMVYFFLVEKAVSIE